MASESPNKDKVSYLPHLFICFIKIRELIILFTDINFDITEYFFIDFELSSNIWVIKIKDKKIINSLDVQFEKYKRAKVIQILLQTILYQNKKSRYE